jgi:hypothetical protein
MRNRAIDDAMAKLKPGSDCWNRFSVNGKGTDPRTAPRWFNRHWNACHLMSRAPTCSTLRVTSSI